MFIELHDSDTMLPILLNISNGYYVEASEQEPVSIYFDEYCLSISESYEEVKDLIKMAAGVVSKEE